MKKTRGFQKKRVRSNSIVVLKTDKSGKMTVMKKDEYERMGKDACSNDEKLCREDIKSIERRLNDHSKMWTKMVNSGVNHGHLKLIMDSKRSESENVAPK